MAVCPNTPFRASVVVLGPPSAGIYSLVSMVADKNNLQCVHLETIISQVQITSLMKGRMLKIKRNKGEDNKTYVNAVVDSIMELLHNTRADSSGFLMYGFPKSTFQAYMLRAALVERESNIDCAIVLDIEDNLIKDRSNGRFCHKASGRSYHEDFFPSKVPLTDELTLEAVKRDEYKPEILQEKLDLYHKQTEEVLGTFKLLGIPIHRIDASKPEPEVIRAMSEKIKEVKAINADCSVTTSTTSSV